MNQPTEPPSRTFVEVIRWCLPALIIGIVLRGLMIWAMPLAYVQHDSVRLLVAGAEWLPEDQFDAMTNNVPFLVPALYRLAQKGPGPGLLAIELGQHALGIIQILIAGLLVRWWFVRWKWWIIPITLIFAIHPSFLWYEHAVMLETIYGFSVMTLALAGTWFFRRPSILALSFIGAATWVVAATRPEGKLFLVFSILALVVGFHRRWREMAKGAAVVVLTGVAVAAVSVKGECGLLLYSSVIHLSPEVSSRYPEAAASMASFRAEALDRASRGPAFVSRPQRVAMAAALKGFVKSHPGVGKGENDDERMNSVAYSLAIEACLRRPWALAPLAVQKFRASADELMNGRLTKAWIHDRQITRLHGSWLSMRAIQKDLFGRDFPKPNDVDEFIRSKFDDSRLGWFESLCVAWEQIYTRHFPDTRYPAERLPGLSQLYAVTLLGIVLFVFVPNPSRRFHCCWVFMLGLLWFMVMVTANERARFRFAFDPFVFLYAFGAISVLVDGAIKLRAKRNAAAETAIRN